MDCRIVSEEPLGAVGREGVPEDYPGPFTGREELREAVQDGAGLGLVPKRHGEPDQVEATGADKLDQPLWARVVLPVAENRLDRAPVGFIDGCLEGVERQREAVGKRRSWVEQRRRGRHVGQEQPEARRVHDIPPAPMTVGGPLSHRREATFRN